LEASVILPGDWGMVEAGWLLRPLESADRKVRRRRGRIHQLLWRSSRGASNANEELGGEGR